MLRRIIVIALLAVAALGLTGSTPAQADERTCYSPSVAGFETYDVCYYLPVELSE